MSVLTCRSHIYISKWGICDTERAAALLNNCQPVWLLQGELTRIQMLTHFFPSPCPLGGTVTTPLICCWCIHSSCCRKWAWKWEEMCVTLAFFDNSRQRTSGILFSHDIRGLFISALLHNILTVYKSWKKKKKKKKMDMNNGKWLKRRLFFSYSNSNPGRLGGSHLSCRGLIKKTLSAGMKFPSRRHFALHTYSPLGETKGPLTASLWYSALSDNEPLSPPFLVWLLASFFFFIPPLSISLPPLPRQASPTICQVPLSVFNGL